MWLTWFFHTKEYENADDVEDDLLDISLEDEGYEAIYKDAEFVWFTKDFKTLGYVDYRLIDNINVQECPRRQSV